MKKFWFPLFSCLVSASLAFAQSNSGGVVNNGTSTFTLGPNTNYAPGKGYSAFIGPFGQYQLPPFNGLFDTFTINPNTFPDGSVLNYSWPASTAFTQWGFDSETFGNYLGAPLDPLAPSQLSAITGLTLVYSTVLTTPPLAPQQGFGTDIIIDMFTTSTAGSNQTTVHEVDIQLHTSDLFTHGCNGTSKGTYTDAQGRGWAVLYNAPVICIQPATNYLDALTGSFDMVPLFTYLEGQGVLAATEWFNGVDVGVEPFNGQGTLTYNKFKWLYSITGQSTSAPINTDSPAIYGNPTYGSVVNCYGGKWSGTPVPVLTYVWKRAGTTISGAVSPQYTIATADEATALTCTVTATNATSSANATSAAVTPLAVPDGAYVYKDDMFGQGGWASSGGFSWANGQMIITSISAFNGTNHNVPSIEASKTYKVTWTINTLSAGTLVFIIGGTNGTAHTAPGTYTDSITSSSSPGAPPTITIQGQAAGTTGIVSNISIQRQ